MSWKFIFYDWGGLNAALFGLINHGTQSAFFPGAWIFSNLLNIDVGWPRFSRDDL